MTDCRFRSTAPAHDDPAVIRVALDEGCICFPDDREQDLCAQHAVRATPLGNMELVTWLDEGVREHFKRQGFTYAEEART